ncbi:hypothetical protein SGPA1_80103 [Streptomyces misionensis JCM 4497]
MWGCWRVLVRGAVLERLCACHALCLAGMVTPHRQGMGDTREVCAGRGDGTDCPNGEGEVLVDGVRCEECRHYWELDETEPERRDGSGTKCPIG